MSYLKHGLGFNSPRGVWAIILPVHRRRTRSRGTWPYPTWWRVWVLPYLHVFELSFYLFQTFILPVHRRRTTSGGTRPWITWWRVWTCRPTPWCRPPTNGGRSCSTWKRYRFVALCAVTSKPKVACSCCLLQKQMSTQAKINNNKNLHSRTVHRPQPSPRSYSSKVTKVYMVDIQEEKIMNSAWFLLFFRHFPPPPPPPPPTPSTSPLSSGGFCLCWKAQWAVVEAGQNSAHATSFPHCWFACIPRKIWGWGVQMDLLEQSLALSFMWPARERKLISQCLSKPKALQSDFQTSDQWTVTDCWHVAETLMPPVCDGSSVHYYYYYLAQNTRCRQNDVNFCSLEFSVVPDDTALHSDSHLFLCVVSLSADWPQL